MEKSPDVQKLSEEVPRPGGRDIIKVDGRWGQSFFGGSIIRWLDTGKEERINLDEYCLVKKWDESVGILIEHRGEQFTEEEIETIRWDESGTYPPHLKKAVTVFGEYIKK